MELDRNFLMAIMAIAFLAIILLLSSRIIIKYRKGKGPKVKKGEEIPVLEAVPTTPDSDVIFNSLVQTKRTASNLKRRGIDTSEAEVLIRKAESDYDQGREDHRLDSLSFFEILYIGDIGTPPLADYEIQTNCPVFEILSFDRHRSNLPPYNCCPENAPGL